MGQKCVRTTSSSCGATVNGFRFGLCGPCYEDYRNSHVNKAQCAKWHEVDKWVGECKDGCSHYKDTVTGQTCPSSKWIKVVENCYLLGDTRMTFSDAKQHCQ